MKDLADIDPERLRLLDEAGFVWDALLGTWFHRPTRRAITLETVRDRSVEWLSGWLAGVTTTPD